jgi:hypothetical protein
MIKTLRITIIITAIIAVFFFVISAAFGLRRDKEKEAFLAKPTATEIFKKNAVRPAGQLESPLLKQAQAFALRINPPKPVEAEQTPVEVRKAVEAPKFRLLGTSYLAQEPNRSMALIDEPGKGIHWVSPSDKIDYLTVTRVEDGKVAYTDGKKDMEMLAEKPAEIPGIVVISGPMIDSQRPEPYRQPQQKMTSQDEVKSNIEFIKQIMAEAKEARGTSQSSEHGISAEEANELQGLGEFLKQLEEEQKQNEANAVQTEPNQ